MKSTSERRAKRKKKRSLCKFRGNIHTLYWGSFGWLVPTVTAESAAKNSECLIHLGCGLLQAPV